MKRIIMFVLLFAALKVAGQTTGYLRFDTVRIMKQNGTCELYIINKTKDSLGLLTNVGGGLTQFRRSKMLNDSTIIIGLDTITIHGTGGSGAPSGPAGGDLTGTYPNPTIAAYAVDNSKLAQMPGLSVKGNIGNTTDDVGNIVAANDGNVLRRFGTSIGFGAINLASSNAVTGVLPVGNTDTSSTNHLVTQSDLNDTAAAIRSSGGSSFTAPDALIASTSNTPRAAKDSDIVNTLNQYPLIHPAIFFRGTDTLYFFGDSYTYGTGASTTAKRWSSVLTGMVGAVEVNYGIAGSTLMKRSPVDPFSGAQNMIDRLSTVPTKTFNKKLLIFSFGLNEVGMANAANYTTSNYKTDYDSVMHYVMNKGWEPQQVLIIPPYWMEQTGYDWYNSANGGNGMPTVARHLSFVQATQEVATKWGTMYFNIYEDQRRDDTTQFADVLHPNDVGHAFIAKSVAQYLSSTTGGVFTQSGSTITANVLNSNLQLGSTTATAVTTPTYITMGATYNNTAGDPSKMKVKIFDDGVNNDNYGIGASPSNFELFAGTSGSKFSFYINGGSTPVSVIGDGYAKFGQNTSGVSSATPQYLSLGGTYANSAGDPTKMKFRLYEVVSSASAGLNISFGHMEYFTFDRSINASHDFYQGTSLLARMDTTAFQIPTIPIIAKADSVSSATGGFLFRDAATGTFKITASPGGSNFANANLTFTGNRTHTQAGYSLSIVDNTENTLKLDPANGSYQFGKANTNGAYLSLDTVANSATLEAGNAHYMTLDAAAKVTKVVMNGGYQYLLLDADNSIFKFGDISSAASGNNTFLQIDDANQLTTLNAQLKLSSYGSGTYTGTVTNYLGVTSNGTVVEAATPTGTLAVVNDADHTVTSTESAIRYHNNITASRTLTIPNPSSATNREIWVKWNTISGGGSLNITTTSGTALIYLDGTASSSTYNINTSNQSYLLKSDGTSWYSIGGTH